MSVSTPETFKLSGGSVTANHAQIDADLAYNGYTGSYSSGVITISLPSSSWTNRDFDYFIRIAKANRATFKYVKAS